MKKILLFVLSIGLGFSNLNPAWAGEDKAVSVYAAASLRDVMAELASTFEKGNKLKSSLEFNYAGSNELAHQIVAANGADIFISANEEWMDHVEKSGRLSEGTRKDLVGNRLVIVANQSAKWKLENPQDLSKIPFRFLSLANPEAVPAGKYAKSYLSALQADGKPVWDQVSARVAPALDVRAALTMVETDPTVIGIVYKTDLTNSKKVKVLYEVEEGSLAPIRYPAARIKHDGAAKVADQFYTFLFSKEAQNIFGKYGFTSPSVAQASNKK